MRAIMCVAITKPGGGVRSVRKEVDLPFAPYVGMGIACSAWKDSGKVENVTLTFDPDYEDPYLDVYLGMDETKSAEEQNSLAETYKGHGWTVVGE